MAFGSTKMRVEKQGSYMVKHSGDYRAQRRF